MDITIFRHVRDTVPERRRVTWSQLVKLLSEHDEREQSDGPLWSPVRYRMGTKRGAGNVESVSCLVLDFDDGTPPEDLTAAWDEHGYAYAVYTTYHHMLAKDTHPAVPRWRAVFPLAAEQPAGQSWPSLYRGLARTLAGTMWDVSCSDASRIYYLPACPPGAEHIAYYADGRPLPVHIASADPNPQPKQEHHAPAGRNKPGDDYNRNGDHAALLEQHGWTRGPVRGANEHWTRPEKRSGTSATWHTGERLFYVFTSSAAGLEPGRAYSLFGLRAELEHNGDAAACARELGGRGYGDAPARPAAALALVPPVDDAPFPDDDDIPLDLVCEEGDPDIRGPDDWRQGLTLKIAKDGSTSIETTPGNLALLLMHDAAWKGCLGYDRLSYAARWRKRPPAVPGYNPPEGKLADQHYCYVQHEARRRWGVQWAAESVRTAVDAAAHAQEYHPVQEHLRGLEWDGVDRLPCWLSDYLGCSPDDNQVGEWWLISAAARALQPGCQADHVLVLEGAQGVRKSTALSVLGGRWFSANLGDLRRVDAEQSLLGVWIMEVGELDALKGAAATRIKNFITQRVDHYRPSYGRNFVDRPRACVFAGTTNEEGYLVDTTGGRRFWPVKVGRIDIAGLASVRDQLLAEAVARYERGERWWPEGVEENSALAERVQERQETDPWEQPIQEWLPGRAHGEITISDVLSDALSVDTAHQDRRSGNRVGAILRRCGWYSVHTRAGNVWRRRLV